jgi:hypothetical protein
MKNQFDTFFRKLLFVFCCASVIFSFNPTYAAAKNYYVAINGSDADEGSENSPFRTIKRAIVSANGGDIIYVKAGTFHEGNIEITKKTTSMTNYLCIRNLSNAEVIIDHDGVDYAWWIQNQSFIELNGLIIQNAKEGITILGDCKNIVVKNCSIRNIENRGIFVNAGNYEGYPEYGLITENDFYNNGVDTVGADISLSIRTTNFTISHNKIHGNVDGIVMAEASTGNIIEYNEIFNHTQEDGIDIKYSYARTATARDQYNIVRNNVIYGNIEQTGITVQIGTRNVKIYENEIYNNKWGLWLRSADTGDVEIYNNSMHENEFTGIIINQETKGGVKITGNTIYNNGSTSMPGVKTGISINAGSDYKLSNNLIGNNGLKDSSYQEQVIVDSGQTQSTLIDYDKYYSSWSDKVIKWGGVDMTLDQFRQATSMGANCQYLNSAYNPVPSPKNLSIQ